MLSGLCIWENGTLSSIISSDGKVNVVVDGGNGIGFDGMENPCCDPINSDHQIDCQNPGSAEAVLLWRNMFMQILPMGWEEMVA